MMSVKNVVQRILSSAIYRPCGIRNLSSSITISKEPKQNPDILMSRFVNATSVQGVLDTFSQHKDVMNSKHIMQALRSVFILQKEGRSELSSKTIINNQQFVQLCGKLKTLAGVINSHEAIDALKYMTYVEVPKDSTIVQVLLQLLRHNVNDLSLQQIVFTDFLLNHYRDVPLAEALKIALPIVFEIQLPIKIDSENIHLLREYLQFATTHRLSDRSIDLILSKMMNFKDEYNIKIAKSIIWSLTEVPPRPSFEPLISKNLDLIRTRKKTLPFNDLDITFKRLTTAYQRSQYHFFRNESFCKYVADYLIDNNMGYKECIYVMKKLDILNVTNRPLIDFVANSIVDSGENDFYFYYTFLKYLSKNNYRPRNWDTIIERIQNMEITALQNIDTLMLAVTLCHHEIFPENIISQVLSRDFANDFAKRRKTMDLYLTLYHSLKLYKPELLHLVPSDFDPKSYVEEFAVPDTFPLKGALFNAFGGENYVKSMMYSKEGIFIDHVILFRKGGYPVATNFESTFIEDVVIPEDNEMVLIMCLQPEAYTEENYLKQKYSIQLKLLESLGYTVIPVNLKNWISLLDFEKIPYLVQNIKNKLGPEMSVNTYG